jgi:MFS family permease
VTITLILSFMTGGQIVYGITFLTTLPQYECQAFYEGYSVWKWDVCDRAEICDSNMPSALWRINYDAGTSYHNWVDPDKLDLTCVSKNTIGAIGSMFFVGFAISSGFVPRLGDKIGRKVPYLASMSTQFLMYILLFVSRNIYLTIFCYFVIGLASGGRVAIGTMYLNEFIPAKYQQVVITALNCGDGTTMAF